MKEIQKSKEYNSKTGKWEMMSFKENRKGDVSVAPKKKAMAKKMGIKEKFENSFKGYHKDAPAYLRNKK